MKYKVCVYAICKNEEQFVDRWMDSMQEADLIVVTDTGSTDDTVKRLEARGAIVYTDIVKPWRFDVARNISLSHVPEDVDICVCTDLDEVFHKGWREHLERAWNPSATMGNYLYNWSLKPDGSPDVQFHYFKIHARHGYRWKHPVHECLAYEGTLPEHKVFLPGVVLDHHPDPTKSRSSYLPLLELAVQEDPENDRMAYYLGREYFFKGQLEDCIRTLTAYLKLPSATWPDERCAAMRLIAKCYSQQQDAKNAEIWFYRAVAEQPFMREPYVECAQHAYRSANWPMAYCMCETALKIKTRSTTYINTGYSWDHTPHDLCAIACYRLGMYEKAQQHAEEALRITPEDPRLANNLMLIKRKINLG